MNQELPAVNQELDLVLPARKKKKRMPLKQRTKFTISLSGDKHQDRDFVLSNLRRSPALVCPVSPVQRPLSANKLFINCDDLVHIPLKTEASLDKQSDVLLQQEVSQQASNDGTTKSEFQQLGGIGSPRHVQTILPNIGKQDAKTISLTKECIAADTKASGAYIQRVMSGNQDIKLLSVAQYAIT